MRVDTEREALRQRSVGAIIQAHDVESQIREREATGELTRLKAQALRDTARFNVPMAQAQLDAEIALTKERQAGTTKAEEATITERALRPERIAEARANVTQSQAAAEASRAQAGRVVQLTQQERELFESGRATRAVEDQVYEWNDPELGKVQMLGKNLPQYLQAAARGRQEAANQAAIRAEALVKIQEAKTESEEKRLEKAATSEFRILNLKNAKGEAVSPQAMSPEADVFNATSTKPNVYIYFPDQAGTAVGRLIGQGELDPRFSDAIVPVPIPRIPDAKKRGLPQTARELYAVASRNSMTVKQYLELMYKAVGEKTPWPPGY